MTSRGNIASESEILLGMLLLQVDGLTLTIVREINEFPGHRAADLLEGICSILESWQLEAAVLLLSLTIVAGNRERPDAHGTPAMLWSNTPAGNSRKFPIADFLRHFQLVLEISSLCSVTAQ